jgi:arylsulfatase A-like enzyme
MQSTTSGNPTSYEAMRTPNYLYVEYRDGERELYDLRSDPDELFNLAPNLTDAESARLHQELSGLENCHAGDACWSAGHVSANP